MIRRVALLVAAVIAFVVVAAGPAAAYINPYSWQTYVATQGRAYVHTITGNNHQGFTTDNSGTSATVRTCISNGSRYVCSGWNATYSGIDTGPIGGGAAYYIKHQLKAPLSGCPIHTWYVNSAGSLVDWGWINSC